MNGFAFYRVWAVVLRYFYVMPRNIARFFDMFYWPIIDLFLWGFTGVWIQQTNHEAAHLKYMLIAAAILWQIISRFTIEIPRNILEELWSGSMINLFSSPVTIAEWLFGITIVAIGSMITTFFTLGGAAGLIYGFNIFSFGWKLLPLMFVLMLFGLSLGIFSAGLVAGKGVRLANITWAMPWFFTPFGGIFYPLDSLPWYLAALGRCFPLSYVFSAMREIIISQVMPWEKFFIGLVLAMLYLPLTFLFFTWMFKRSCQQGLSRLNE